MERADEGVREEGHVDHAGHGERGGEAGGRGAGQFDAEAQQCQSVGVVVHDGAGHEAQHGDDGVRDEVPDGQDGGHRADRVVADVFGEFGVGSGEQQAVEDEKHVGDGRAERGPEDDAAVGGLAGQVA